MKGIAIIGGECPQKERLQNIIPVNDFSQTIKIVAADSGLIFIEEAGFVPDFIVGDMDSLDDLRRLEKYPKEKIIQYPQDKDYTDTELALDLLWEKGCDEVWIIGGGGGRIDHLFALYSLFDREQSPDRWFIPGYELRLIKTRTELKIHKECQISLFPLGNGPWKIQSKGLKWPLDNLPWKRGFCSISNLTNDHVQEFYPVHGRFLLIIPEAMN
ncbi:MAG: thiamine diphosphokinase [Treponema sp.]|jgi:thiamine pyrophosphokinase|nr:thiamine diphosphokinase [Treponema sp.]